MVKVGQNGKIGQNGEYTFNYTHHSKMLFSIDLANYNRLDQIIN